MKKHQWIVFLLVSAFTVGTLVAEEGSKKRRDNPGEAAAFHAFVLGGGSGPNPADGAVPIAAREGVVGGAGGAVGEPKVSVRPIPIPANAMLAAMERVKAMREQVAPPGAGGAAGQARVGGIPVGKLLSRPKTLSNGQRVVVPLTVPLAGLSSLDPSGWKSQGPGNIGGRVRSMVIHPTDPLTMWIGGVAGGVWKTSDGGTSWAPLTDFMASVAISSMAIDPGNPDRIYVGTGEGFRNTGAVRGFGIFVTEDGGGTWTQLTATANDDFQYVNRIAIAASGSNNIMLVATETGVFRSEDDGATFAKVVGNAPGGRRSLDVRISPADVNQCVATSSNFGDDGRVFFSKDAGKTWAFSSGLAASGRIEITFAKANPSVVYAVADASKGIIYRSLDGGETFSFRGAPGHLGHPTFPESQGWYNNCVWAGDPTNPNLLVVGGIDLHRSLDGGASFTKISNWDDNDIHTPHADNHAIVSHPSYNGTTNREVFIGNDGGVVRALDITTANQTSGWLSLNNGLSISQCYGIGVHQATGALTAGLQDNGSVFNDGSGSTDAWTEVFGGDGGESAVDSVGNFFYGEYVHLDLHRSAGGARAENIKTFTDGAFFIAPFILSPNDPKILYAGGTRLWRTMDARVASPAFSPLTSQQLLPGTADADAISAIAVATGDENSVWIGYGNSFVATVRHQTLSSSGALVWQTVNGLPQRYVTRIVVNPADKKNVYVLQSGYQSENLHVSKDEGLTWTALGSGVLPDVPFFDLAIHPDSSDLLYLGTEVGLFASEDGGVNWSPTSQGPTNAPTRRLVWKGKELFVGTHGRGIFSIDLSQAVTPIVPAAGQVIQDAPPADEVP